MFSTFFADFVSFLTKTTQIKVNQPIKSPKTHPVNSNSCHPPVQAQKALHQCLLGNTTIHANAATDNEVAMILQQLGVNPVGQQSAGGGNSLVVASQSSTPMTSAAVTSGGSRFVRSVDRWLSEGHGYGVGVAVEYRFCEALLNYAIVTAR